MKAKYLEQIQTLVFQKNFKSRSLIWFLVLGFRKRYLKLNYTAKKIKISIKDSFTKCDQIRNFLRVWSHSLEKSLMENFIFCAVFVMHFFKLKLIFPFQIPRLNLKYKKLTFWDTLHQFKCLHIKRF